MAQGRVNVQEQNNQFFKTVHYAIVAIAMTLFLFFSLPCLYAFAIDDLDYVLGRPMTQEEKDYQKSLVPDLPPARKLPLTADPVKESDEVLLTQSELPLEFDLRDKDQNRVTPVRNQNPWGTCWAFASCASMESNILTKGLSASSVPNLSPLQLAYFTYHKPSTVRVGLEGDSTTLIVDDEGTGFLSTGGNFYLATATLSAWTGAINEDDLPYSKVSPIPLQTKFEDKYAYSKNTYVLTDVDWISRENPEIIKSQIMADGAVGGSYLHDNSYYNEETSAYFRDVDDKSSNHAVTIVGWDDNFSRENFGDKDAITPIRPKNNGAWLVKNSWGTEWGREGYFWLSYEDTSLTEVHQFEVERYNPKASIYQYDGTGYYFDFENSGDLQDNNYLANVFCARDNEILNTVSFYTIESNTAYDISIYRNSSKMGKPDDGVLVWQSDSTKTLVLPGYHSIDVGPVSLQKDDYFSVIINYHLDGAIPSLAVATSYNDGVIDFTEFAKEGQSYTAFGDGEWTDIGSEKKRNACIKAFTTTKNNSMKLEDASIKPIADQIYTGNALTPKPIVEYNGSTLVENLDYTLSYQNNINKGIGSVTATGRGNYSGTISKNFNIVKRWDRWEGNDRYDTMRSIVNASGFSQGATVIIATGEDFPDALAASGLAGSQAAPIILTDPNELSPQALTLIKDLNAQQAIIVGGTSAVSSNIEAKLRSTVKTVVRYQGDNRNKTALSIYYSQKSDWSSTAIIAYGYDFADALSIAPYAWKTKSPIFLTEYDGSLSTEIKQAIYAGGFSRILIVGGTSVVNSQVENEFRSAGKTVVRQSGNDRYQTSVAIAQWCVETEKALSYNKLAIATGLDYPDALAGGSMCGKNEAIMLLVDDVEGGDYALNTLVKNKANKIGQGYTLGGSGVVSSKTQGKILELINK